MGDLDQMPQEEEANVEELEEQVVEEEQAEEEQQAQSPEDHQEHEEEAESEDDVEEESPEPELPRATRLDLLEMQLENERAARQSAERDRDQWKTQHDHQRNANRRMGQQLKQSKERGFIEDDDGGDQAASSPADHGNDDSMDPRVRRLFEVEAKRVLQEEARQFASKYEFLAEEQEAMAQYLTENSDKLKGDVEALDLDRVGRTARQLLTEAALKVMGDQAPKIEAARKVRKEEIRKKKKLATPASRATRTPKAKPFDPSQAVLTDPEQRKRAMEEAAKALFDSRGQRK